MATKATEVSEFSKKNSQYVERLFYDVLAYTLPICGFTGMSLLTTDCGENTYKSSNFIESAGASILTKSLGVRNEWSKPMWIAILPQENSSRVDYEFVVLVLNETFSRFHKKEVPVTKNFLVEMSLAFCNEMFLFAHQKRMDIDFNKLIKSVSSYVVSAIAPNRDVSEITNELFIEFHNISSYTKWITDFIKKFAVPYGSRDDVPELFSEHFKKLWEFEEPTSADTPFVIKQKNPEGFLPHQLFTDIAAEESVSFSESLAWESNLPYLPESSESDALRDGKSCEKLSANVSEQSAKSLESLSGDFESPKLPESSESDALRDGKSREKLPTRVVNVSEQSAQRGQICQDSSELGIEDDLGQMSLGAKGDYQESHGATPKQKMPEQEKPIRKSS